MNQTPIYKSSMPACMNNATPSSVSKLQICLQGNDLSYFLPKKFPEGEFQQDMPIDL